MNILAIDPGLHQYGWADIAPNSCCPFTCGLGSTLKPKPVPSSTNYDVVVVELPQQRGRHSPVKMSDLIRLSAVAGQLGGPRCEFATVSEWKGNEAKESMHRRLIGSEMYDAMFPKAEYVYGEPPDKLLGCKGILSESELKVVQNLDCIPSKKHNVIDAICLLMWRLGRLKTKGSKRWAISK